MFVWVFHRISGLLLIVLVGSQILTGFSQGTISESDYAQMAAKLHNHPLIICVLVFLFIFHSLYGVRTILMDVGLRREKAIFWGATLLGIVLFSGFLVFYFSAVWG